MKVALVGAGGIGSVHAQHLAEDRRVDELVVADVDRDRATALASRCGGREATVEAALDGAFDAIVIATPTQTHGELILQCIDRPLALFCEKPLSADYGEAREVVNAIKQHGTRLQLGFMRRFDPGHLRLRQALQDGALGKVLVIRMASHDHYPVDEQYVAGSGGIFRDLLVHDFDALRWVTRQEPVAIYAQGAVRDLEYVRSYNDVDTCALIVEMEDDTLVCISAARENGRGEDVRVEAMGTMDSAVLGLGPRTPLWALDHDAPESDTVPYEDHVTRFGAAYRAEIDHFLSYAEGKIGNGCTAEDGLAALRMAVAAERSLLEKRRFPMAELE